MSDWYREKLQDPRWQRKRLEILQRDNWRCTICYNDRDTLHVHHTKYSGNPWEIDNSFLITLCKNCHKQEELEKDDDIEKEGDNLVLSIKGTIEEYNEIQSIKAYANQFSEQEQPFYFPGEDRLKSIITNIYLIFTEVIEDDECLNNNEL